MVQGQQISRQTAPFLYDQREAVDLLRRVRWRNSFYCPRCGSTDVRQVETDRILEAFSCRGCQYNFTTLANSYFHSSRIPVFDQLRFLIAIQLEPVSSAGRLGRFFRWHTGTVSRQLEKLPRVEPVEFVRRTKGYLPFESFQTIEAYFEQPGIELLPKRLALRLDQLFDTGGRALRRSARAKSEERPIRSNKPFVVQAPPRADATWVRPSSVECLMDESVARKLVETLRWADGKKRCPRCDSSRVIAVKTNVYRDLYRCQDCKNTFNPMAGTMFQRSKMPTHRFFQYFVLQNALGDAITIQEVCFALKCTVRTAMAWLARGKEMGFATTFAVADKALADALPQSETGHGGGSSGDDNAGFLALCAQKGIVVDETALLGYARAVSQG